MLMLAMTMVVMALTSCLNDNNEDTGLSRQDIERAFRYVEGSHSGKLKYVKSIENNKAWNDSVDATCRFVSDSVLTIQNVPVSQIAQFVQNNDSVKKYLALQPNQELKCNTYYTTVSPVQMYVNPYVHYIDLQYGGKTHRVAITFYYMNNYSFGAYWPLSERLELQFIVSGVFVDMPANGFGTNLITTGLTYYFHNK